MLGNQRVETAAAGSSKHRFGFDSESISGLPDCGGRDRFHLVARMRIDRIATPWTSCWVTIRFPVSE